MDLVFVHRNRVQWTRFLYIEIESIGLDFFSALYVSCRSHSKNFQNNTHNLSHSLSLSVSLTLTLTLTLIPSRFVLSFPLTPSLTLIPFCSVSHSHSLSLRRHHPSAPLLSQQSLPSSNDFPTTAGYHSHLISSMRFLGFISLYE